MSEIILPVVEKAKNDTETKKRLLVLSEGFEERSLSFISLSKDLELDKIIICKYYPQKKSKYTDLKSILSEYHKKAESIELTFKRFEPVEFENDFQDIFSQINNFDEVIVDISVMSKFLIMQIFYILSTFRGKVKIIYTEPTFHAPSEEEFNQSRALQSNATLLPFSSSGVHNVIRTPLLSSTVMQKSPTLLVSFLSFNEQLIRALLSECSPMHLYLINGISSHYHWREDAMLFIHENVRKEYIRDNPIDENNKLERRVSIIDYRETFELLASIYNTHCIDSRIVLSPTGTKMQTIGCALIKLCCPDIHIEYPTPESYYIDGYSSSTIREIHQVVFNDMPDFIKEISMKFRLNG
jgi:DNA-directed RNA polymerase subunit F